MEDIKFFGFLKLVDLIPGVIAGFIATGLWVFFTHLIKVYRNFKVKKILGDDADIQSDKKYHLIYAEFILRNDIKKLINSVKFNQPRFEYQKSNNSNIIISIDYPISKCEVIASNYINSDLFSKFGIKSEIISDLRFSQINDFDKSIISFGGSGSNEITNLILNDENNFFRDVETKNNELANQDPFHAYGYVLRIRPKSFNNRVWIICAGLGEQGTSGTAWYLANKYEELLKFIFNWDDIPDLFNSGNFLAFFKTKPGHDDSTTLVKIIKEKTCSVLSKSKIEEFDINDGKRVYQK